jgi:hypothetical protein
MQRKFCLTCLCNILPKSCWSLQFPLAPATCRSREVGGDRREQRSQLLSPPYALPAPVGAPPVTLLPPHQLPPLQVELCHLRPQGNRRSAAPLPMPPLAVSIVVRNGRQPLREHSISASSLLLNRGLQAAAVLRLHPPAEEDDGTAPAASPSPSMQRNGSMLLRRPSTALLPSICLPLLCAPPRCPPHILTPHELTLLCRDST